MLRVGGRDIVVYIELGTLRPQTKVPTPLLDLWDMDVDVPLSRYLVDGCLRSWLTWISVRE